MVVPWILDRTVLLGWSIWKKSRSCGWFRGWIPKQRATSSELDTKMMKQTALVHFHMNTAIIGGFAPPGAYPYCQCVGCVFMGWVTVSFAYYH